MTVQVITENTGANIRATYDEAYTGESDTRINANAATTNYSGDGAGFPLQAAYFGASDEQNTLVQFDISNIPAGATINSATLSMMTESVGWAAGPIACYRILQPVVIAQATWNIYSTGNSWNTGGGLGSGIDRSASAEDTNSAVDTATGTEEFWDVTTAIAAAVAEEASTVTLQLWYTGTNSFYGHGFSNDADTDGVRAELVIDYTTTATVTGSGTPAAQAASVSGTSERELTGSGTPAAQAGTTTGAAERVLTCSGTLLSGSASTAGTALLQLKLLLTAAVGRELRDEEGALVSSLAGIIYEFYEKDTDTEGNPDFSGTFNTDANGEATIQLPGTALTAGQYGLLVLEHPSDNTIRGVYRIPVA